jgi:hypothetical protein
LTGYFFIASQKGTSSMIKITGTAVMDKDFNDNLKKGDVVKIDALKQDNCQSGIMIRIVGHWSRPQWFDAAWFKGLST